MATFTGEEVVNDIKSVFGIAKQFARLAPNRISAGVLEKISTIINDPLFGAVVTDAVNELESDSPSAKDFFEKLIAAFLANNAGVNTL